MNAYLLWDPAGAKPPIGSVLCNQAPHIHYVEGVAGLSSGLRQMARERPELIFLSADPAWPGYGALVRSVRRQHPGAYLIAVEERGTSSSALENGAHMVLPLPFSDKQLLDGILRAELAQSRETSVSSGDRTFQQTVPGAEEFLDALEGDLNKFPENLCQQHWEGLRQWMEREPDTVGWYLAGLTTSMIERVKTRQGDFSALVTAHGECLKVLSGSPSEPLWKKVYEKSCALYIEELQAGADPAGRQIARIKQYIDEHIEEGVSLKQAAQEVYLSTAYLSRLFKSKTGMNVSDYISQRKIERAKMLLAETDLSVAEISRRLNYPEQNSFSRFFKGKAGMPPQAFRTLNAKGAKERAAPPEPVLEDFEITDFGPCAFTSDDLSFAYSFNKRR